VQHPGGQAGQSPQAVHVVQITAQGHHPLVSQTCLTLRGGREGQHTGTPHQRGGDPLADITAAHDQDALSSKARRQRAKGGLV